MCHVCPSVLTHLWLVARQLAAIVGWGLVALGGIAAGVILGWGEWMGWW